MLLMNVAELLATIIHHGSVQFIGSKNMPKNEKYFIWMFIHRIERDWETVRGAGGPPFERIQVSHDVGSNIHRRREIACQWDVLMDIDICTVLQCHFSIL